MRRAGIYCEIFVVTIEATAPEKPALRPEGISAALCHGGVTAEGMRSGANMRCCDEWN